MSADNTFRATMAITIALLLTLVVTGIVNGDCIAVYIIAAAMFSTMLIGMALSTSRFYAQNG